MQVGFDVVEIDNCCSCNCNSISFFPAWGASWHMPLTNYSIACKLCLIFACD